jgi:hypothetical protein
MNRFGIAIIDSDVCDALTGDKLNVGDEEVPDENELGRLLVCASFKLALYTCT